MNFTDAYRSVAVKILGLDHIRIEIVHKVDKTIIRPGDPLQAFALGVGKSLPDLLVYLAHRAEKNKQLKKWGVTG